MSLEKNDDRCGPVVGGVAEGVAVVVAIALSFAVAVDGDCSDKW